MIGEKELARYRSNRSMSPDEKLRETEQLLEGAFAVLDSLPPDERRRRWELWMKEDEESARELAARLAALPK